MEREDLIRVSLGTIEEVLLRIYRTEVTCSKTEDLHGREDRRIEGKRGKIRKEKGRKKETLQKKKDNVFGDLNLSSL